MADANDIDALIERSSLGTPGAKRIRARTPIEVAQTILEISSLHSTQAEAEAAGRTIGHREAVGLVLDRRDGRIGRDSYDRPSVAEPNAAPTEDFSRRPNDASVKTSIHVIPQADGWAVMREGAKHASSLHAIRAEAEAVAWATAQREGVKLVLHGPDGQGQEWIEETPGPEAGEQPSEAVQMKVAPAKATADAQVPRTRDVIAAIGPKVRELRRQKNLSLQQLAERSGVSAEMIHKIERNARVPTIPTLMKLASALNFPVACLVEAETVARARDGTGQADPREPKRQTF